MVAISQNEIVDTFGKGSSFFLEIRKIPYGNETSYGYCMPPNPYLDCYKEKLSYLVALATHHSQFPRMKTNDSTKLNQYVSLKVTTDIMRQEKSLVCEKAIEQALNCKITDSIMNCNVWILCCGKVHKLKPIQTDSTLYEDLPEHRRGVYIPEDAPFDNIIVKNGILQQLYLDLESLSNHIILLEDESRKMETFTFEILKPLVERGNFDEIKAALKEAIDFDLYKAVRPVKIKYVKFLE